MYLKPNVTVSVIVPCYNQAQYLKEALDSVLGQTYNNWECIIVDDGSTDNCKVISDLYINEDQRFKYIYQENAGLSSARNSGIKTCSGEFILPLDADDIIGRTYIQKGIEAFAFDSKIKLVYCKAEKFGLTNGCWNLKEYSFNELLTENIIFCSAIFRKSSYSETNGYDESMVNGHEDWDFLLQLLSSDDLVYRMDEVNFFYRIKGKSTIYTNENHEIHKRQYIYKKHIDKYYQCIPDPILLLRENNELNIILDNSYNQRFRNKFKRQIILLRKLRRLIFRTKNVLPNI